MQAFTGDIEVNEHSRALLIPFAGSDFKCPFFSPSLVRIQQEQDAKDVRDIRQKISSSVGIIDKVVLTGGEPCLQRQALLAVVDHAKSIGLSVILHTSGSKPECIKHLLDFRLVDRVILDIYSPLREEMFERITLAEKFHQIPVPTSNLKIGNGRYK